MHEDVNPVEPAALAAAEAKLELERQLARKLEVDDFKWLMADKRGRRIMWRLLSMTRVFHATFDESTKRQDFMEGQRNVGLHFLSEAHEHCLDAYHLMEKEHATNAKRHATR